MKKNLVRVLAFGLVLILALGIIPLGALAVEVTVTQVYYDKKTPIISDHPFSVPGATDRSYSEGATIKTSDYNSTRIINGSLYDFSGFVDNKAINDAISNINSIAAFNAFMKSDIPFINGDINIPTDLDSKEGQEWYAIWNSIQASYVPHGHKLSYWYSDGTTHWRECLVCKNYWREGLYEQFMFQNWHSDGDEDRICDVCDADIPYHEITVEDTKGGKITVSEEEAPHRKKIYATVEPDEGYKLKKIHFIKVRDDGSEQEITRRKSGKQWYCLQPTYDLKVTAEFVKKN